MPQQIEYNPDKDYYSILGIRLDSSMEEIRTMWRKKAFELHPDRNPKTDDRRRTIDDRRRMIGRIQDINEAYSVLKEPEKRKVYDRKRALYIARTFKFREGFCKNSSIPESYDFYIEPHLENNDAPPWYCRVLKGISSTISRSTKYLHQGKKSL